MSTTANIWSVLHPQPNRDLSGVISGAGTNNGPMPARPNEYRIITGIGEPAIYMERGGAYIIDDPLNYTARYTPGTK